MPYSSSSSGTTDRVRAAGGGVLPGSALPARSRVRTQRAAACPRHTAPWAVALHLRVSAARNFPPRSAPTPPVSPSTPALGPFGCSSRDRRPSLPGRHLSNSERYTWFFLAGLLFSFSWNNNNNGSGSAHKKPGARKELPGGATVGRQVQAVSSGGSGGGSDSSGASSGLWAALSGGTGRRV